MAADSTIDDVSWRDAPRGASCVFAALATVVVAGGLIRVGESRLTSFEAIGLWGGFLAIVSAVRWSWAPVWRDASPFFRDVVWYAAFVFVGLAAVALTQAGLSDLALAAVWAMAGCHEGLWWRRKAIEFAPEPEPVASQDAKPATQVARPAPESTPLRDPPAPLAIATPHEDDDAEIVATQTRSRVNGHVESVGGFVRAAFAPGERTKTIHVGFTPPLAGDPKVEWEQVDGDACSIRVDEARCFGLRIELRLDRPADAERIVAIEYAATAQA